MRVLVAALLFGSAVGAHPDKYYKDLFDQFKKDFSKSYDSNGDDEGRRFGIFKTNVDFIEAENAKGHSYTLGVTEFADLTADEFGESRTCMGDANQSYSGLPYLGRHQVTGAAPASVDWRSKAVTPVKNQGSCGSCWAFSTTGGLEGAYAVATNKLVSLSEQQLVDCAKSFGEQGCQGGLMDGGFRYAEQNAMCTETSYPYKAKNGQCHKSGCAVGIPEGVITGFKDVAHDDTDALMSAIAQQPVSIAIEADKSVFQLYKSGVLDGNCGTKLDHGVLLVGYGTDSETNKDYWIVKNSWGASWGMDGYVKLLRGKTGAGECGLKSQASYPVASGKPGPAPGPTPPPSPPSPPSPPTPGSTHYEHPPCRSDEVEAQVQGTSGSLCAPKCDGTTCPSDVPTGTTAKPACILQDSSSGEKYCALQCGLGQGKCPTGASCSNFLTGVCTYPSEAKEELTLEIIDKSVTV